MPHVLPFPTSVRLAIAVALAHLGTACTEDSGGDEGSLDAVPTFEGTVDLEFGEIDGDDPYLFTRIESIAEDARGRLIVADMQSHEIRVFDSEGRFLFRFGGPGEGPGELTFPCCLAFGPDGALWVRESTRYSAFQLEDAGAEYVRGQRFVHLSQGMVAPITFDGEGRLIDIGPSHRPESGSVMTRFHLDADGAADEVPMVDPERQATGSTTVDRMLGEMAVTMFVRQPFGPLWIHAHGRGGSWAEAVTSDYVVNLHHADGAEYRIEGPPLPGPELSSAEQDWAQDRLDRDLQRLDLGQHPFGIPDRKPPLSAIYFDRSGRLWIEKTGAAGNDLREADVYEGDALVARYRWPVRVRPGSVPWASESVLYGITTDSLGVQRVARVRFRPAG